MMELPIITRRNPTRRITGVAVSRMVMAPAALANVVRPDDSAFMPNPTGKRYRQQERQRAHPDPE